MYSTFGVPEYVYIYIYIVSENVYFMFQVVYFKLSRPVGEFMYMEIIVPSLSLVPSITCCAGAQ